MSKEQEKLTPEIMLDVALHLSTEHTQAMLKECKSPNTVALAGGFIMVHTIKAVLKEKPDDEHLKAGFRQMISGIIADVSSDIDFEMVAMRRNNANR